MIKYCAFNTFVFSGKLSSASWLFSSQLVLKNYGYNALAKEIDEILEKEKILSILGELGINEKEIKKLTK
jgi:hypothetical protein